MPPEDVVFHRFYMNKTSSSKKPKAKKKASQDDEDAEDFLDASDESEEEKIDNMLGSGHHPLEEADGEYDYDDLDRVADEDDDDLLGDGSDAEAGLPPNLAARKRDEGSAGDDGDNDSLDIMDGIAEEDGDVDVDDDVIGGESDEDESSQAAKTKRGKKRKFDGKNRRSPFANVEEYEHLLNDNMDTTKISRSHKRKKKKTSS